MKRCKPFTCWTDYPFIELGDAPNQVAPIRRVKVLSYDGDKYAQVEAIGTGATSKIKAGYLYRQPARRGQTKVVNRRKLERML